MHKVKITLPVLAWFCVILLNGWQLRKNQMKQARLTTEEALHQGYRLGTCINPGCNQQFVTRHTKKMYCSSKCKWKVWNQRNPRVSRVSEMSGTF